MARLTLNRIGQKFGLLTVVARAPGHGPYGRAAWLCECKCGTSGLVISNTGIKKRKNCGCCRKHRVSRRKETLTQSQLKELIEFNSQTGEFTWRVASPPHAQIGDRAGCFDSKGYWKIGVDGKVYLAHRLAFLYVYGRWPDGPLDHKNRNPASCQITDLREATPGQNSANKKLSRANTSGFKGVSINRKRNKYKTTIGFRRKHTHLGYYNTAREAALAYDYVATRVFGVFALTNRALGLLDHKPAAPPTGRSSK